MGLSHWLVNVFVILNMTDTPWTQVSGSWLCCSHADTLLFTAVLAEGSAPDAPAESALPAELCTRNTEGRRQQLITSNRSETSLALTSQFIWQSPNLHFSEPVRLQGRGTTSGGSRRERELPRSSCTGGGLVAWLPKCRRVHGSLPWRDKDSPFNLKVRDFFEWKPAAGFDHYVYLHVIEDVSCIQVNPIGFLVDGHDCEAHI